jgi:hypothetical protein
MQPTAQAVGKYLEMTTSPEGAKEQFSQDSTPVFIIYLSFRIGLKAR